MQQESDEYTELIKFLVRNDVSETLNNIFSNVVIEAFVKNHIEIPIGFYKFCRSRGIFMLKRRIEWQLKQTKQHKQHRSRT